MFCISFKLAAEINESSKSEISPVEFPLEFTLADGGRISTVRVFNPDKILSMSVLGPRISWRFSAPFADEEDGVGNIFVGSFTDE